MISLYTLPQSVIVQVFPLFLLCRKTIPYRNQLRKTLWTTSKVQLSHCPDLARKPVWSRSPQTQEQNVTKWVPEDWCGHQTLGSFGASKASDKRLVSSIDVPFGPFASPRRSEPCYENKGFFSFPLTLHTFHDISSLSLGKFVSLWDLSSALLLWAYQGKDPFNFQKLCLSINCFCSVLEGLLPPSSLSGHSLCTGSISHYLSWPLVQSSFHPLLELLLSWFALPQPHSVISSILLSTWRRIPCTRPPL